MSQGLIKMKKYDWKDSNMALFGSKTDKEVKKSSAECEPAWKGAGTAPGLIIWRIEKFQVKSWPKESYGEFYNGDSYIVLRTYKNSDDDSLAHDIFFWIGSKSSQDEYGTAAYKTVELDTYLDDVPIQHRECQGHESELFKSCFPKGITTLEGGCESAFRNVPPEQYEPRLFHICRDSKSGNVAVRQIPRAASAINEEDVYILDLGLKLYQYNGAKANAVEKAKGMEYIVHLKEQRGGDAVSEVVDSDCSKNNEFWQNMNQVDDDDKDDDGIPDRKLLRVNTETAESDVVKEGNYGHGDLKSDDVFICDTGSAVYVWVGGNASPSEKKNGLPYAHNYLRGSGFPWRPITVLREGQKCHEFDTALAA